MKGLAFLLFSTTFALLLVACSNPRNEVVTKSNEDSILAKTGRSLSESERQELVAAFLRAATGQYSVEGKTVGEILSEEAQYDAAEKTEQEHIHQEQIREQQRQDALRAKIDSAIEIFPISKTFSPANYDIEDGDIHQDQIVVVFKIHNKTAKTIKEITGDAEFENSFGKSIESASLDYTEPIPAGATVTYTGVLNYNQFMGSDQQLRDAPLTDLRFIFEPAGLTFADGSQLLAPGSD